MAAILTFYAPNYKEIADITLPVNQEYADRHGYDFVVKSDNFNSGAHLYFEKQVMVRKCLDKYDWVFYLDIDAMIMNHTRRLEEFLEGNSDFIVASGITRYVNGGVFFARSCSWVKKFMEDIVERRNSFNPKDDTITMSGILKQLPPNQKSRVSIVPRKLFNTYAHQFHNEFRKGDFVMHVLAANFKYRKNVFEQNLRNIIR